MKKITKCSGTWCNTLTSKVLLMDLNKIVSFPLPLFPYLFSSPPPPSSSSPSTTRKKLFCNTSSATPVLELSQNRHLQRLLRLVGPTVAGFLAIFLKRAFTYSFLPKYFSLPLTISKPWNQLYSSFSLSLNFVPLKALLSPSETQSYSITSNPQSHTHPFLVDGLKADSFTKSVIPSIGSRKPLFPSNPLQPQNPHLIEALSTSNFVHSNDSPQTLFKLNRGSPQTLFNNINRSFLHLKTLFGPLNQSFVRFLTVPSWPLPFSRL